MLSSAEISETSSAQSEWTLCSSSHLELDLCNAQLGREGKREGIGEREEEIQSCLLCSHSPHNFKCGIVFLTEVFSSLDLIDILCYLINGVSGIV